MKQILLFTFLLFSCNILSSQVYVNSLATGSNDGTSWENAYTDIGLAVQNVEEFGAIWVASGTYLAPSTGNTVDTFISVERNMEIYGGFAGTETTVDERDPSANVVIITADQKGDDSETNAIDNREDNNLHIMIIQDTATNATIIDGITFSNGTTQDGDGSGNGRRGGAILCFGAPIINNCTFTQNYGFFGGGIYPRGAAADGTTITNCNFINNYGGNGAGIYMLAEGTIADCNFENNSVSARGGAIYMNDHNNPITNCTFKNNASNGSSGGAIMLRSNDDTGVTTVSVEDCEFEGNTGTFGGAVGCYDSLSILSFTNCSFNGNSAVNVGGVSTTGFGGTSVFESCTFTENSTGEAGNDGTGGVLFSQNNFGAVTVNNCFFESNAAEVGGAIGLSSDGDPGDLTEDLSTLELTNSIFTLNKVLQQGGAINLSDINATITNCLFDFNFAENEGSYGGAISLNLGDSLTANTTLMNCTVTSNTSTLGSGISSWGASPDAISSLTLQNTILANEDSENYIIEDGTPTVVSNGGNLSSDESMMDILTSMNDVNSEDPLFLEETDMEYYLNDNSPAVNSGIEDGAPLTDIEGNARLFEIDMGAFENQTVSNIKGYKDAKTNMIVSPNPIAGNSIYFELDGQLNGRLDVSIINNLGLVVNKTTIQKSGESEGFMIDNIHLIQGVYHLQVSNTEYSVSRSFIKIK